jgi:hypothetical protein
VQLQVTVNSQPPLPQIRTVIVGAVWIIIGVIALIVLCVAFQLLHIESLVSKFVPVQGVSIFAVAYLEAQFIERIVDPFSVKGAKNNEKDCGTKDNPKKDVGKSGNKSAYALTPFGNWREIDRLEREAAKAQLKKKTLSDSDTELLNQLKTQRVISIWGFSSFLGMVLSCFTFGLFQIIGITFIGGLAGHALDAFLSGVIIGGGTKPLHDVIGYLQESKSKS